MERSIVDIHAPQHRLYFLPDPQGQGSLRATRPQLSGALGSRAGIASTDPAKATGEKPPAAGNK